MDQVEQPWIDITTGAMSTHVANGLSITAPLNDRSLLLMDVLFRDAYVLIPFRAFRGHGRGGASQPEAAISSVATPIHRFITTTDRLLSSTSSSLRLLLTNAGLFARNVLLSPSSFAKLIDSTLLPHPVHPTFVHCTYRFGPAQHPLRRAYPPVRLHNLLSMPY